MRGDEEASSRSTMTGAEPCRRSWWLTRPGDAPERFSRGKGTRLPSFGEGGSDRLIASVALRGLEESGRNGQDFASVRSMGYSGISESDWAPNTFGTDGELLHGADWSFGQS